MRDAEIKIPETELSFSYARSSGPGGQNVNKVNSKAILHWNIYESKSIRADVLNRFVSKFGNLINSEGEVVIQSDRFRDQGRNNEDCREKLYKMLNQVAKPSKKRIPTRPSRTQKAKRLKIKKAHGEKKSRRKRVEY